MVDSRTADLKDFYSLLEALTMDLGGPRALATCSGQLAWPRRGVYFFMENGEDRSESGHGPRIVRVGTHALKDGSTTKLWNRLSSHRGSFKSGGGNHRGSIFRLLVGTALIARDGHDCPTWDHGSNAPAEVKAGEQFLEREVNNIIGAMPFVWLNIDDEPNSESLRGYIERNAITLLSNVAKDPIDAPSTGWLGHLCDRERVRKSGLWNQNHVDDPYDSGFLVCFEKLIREMRSQN